MSLLLSFESAILKLKFKKRQKRECDKLRENKDNLEGYVTVLNYLQQNASYALADKINNGVQIVKDGVTLILF